jgi:signal transduction histidine kinase
MKTSDNQWQGRFFRKVFTRLGLLLVVGMLLICFLTWQIMHHWLTSYTHDQLTTQAKLAQLVIAQRWPATDNSIQAECVRIHERTGLRITVVDPKGVVLGESDANPKEMENHASRPEIAAALGGQIGSHMRKSNTVGVNYVYIAVPLMVDDKVVAAVRAAAPAEDIKHREEALARWITVGLATAIPIAVLSAWLLSRALAAPLQRVSLLAQRLATGDLQSRVEIDGDDEVWRVAESLETMRENLAARIREVARSAAMKTEFVANASHELRTPVASIRAAVETLNADGLDRETTKRFMSVIERNVERLQNLTEDLMHLNRVEVASPELALSRFDPEQVFLSVRSVYAESLRQKNVELLYSSEIDEIETDERWLELVLKNLIDNAVKFVGEGGRIELRCRRHGDAALFEVEDNGCGIPRAELERVFERFYQVDKSRSLSLGGTGLGLAIVKHAVHAMGGEVSVRSEEGQFTIFSFTLPLTAVRAPMHRHV